MSGPIDDALVSACRRDDGSININALASMLGKTRSTVQHQVRKLAFSVERPPVTKERSLDELIAHRIAESKRARDYEEYNKLIRINIHTAGPIGLMVFGDPHIDDPGCDFELLQQHLGIAASRSEYVFAGNIGDLRNNWIGRLERLKGSATVSDQETWTLVEWMMSGAGVRWTWLVRGNHDAWAGTNDPLDWIAKGAQVGVDGDAGVRIAFKHPNGVETRLHARHNFNGHSQFNPLHGLKKEVLHGFRDHVIVAGHLHIGADAGDFDEGSGLAFQMVRASGYKISDSFRRTIGAHVKPIHPAALIIVDPDEPDTSRGRAWCAPTVEIGAQILDGMRNRFNSRPRPAHGKAQGRVNPRSKAKAA